MISDGWARIETVDRLEATLATMNRLERFHGHFYNWYDTHDLRPLEPKFVSAVDSGNLAGHLIALGTACREMKAAPAPAEERLERHRRRAGHDARIVGAGSPTIGARTP